VSREVYGKAGKKVYGKVCRGAGKKVYGKLPGK
jgi:hypothetical protein